MTPKMKEAELSLDLIRLRTYTNKNELRYMSHRDFEFYVADFLRLTRDLKTYVTQAAKDGGKDIIAFDDDDEKIYVEVKHWKGNVGRPAIQKLYGAMIADKIKRGYFITSSGFTKDALQYASKTNITLIDGNELIRQLHT
jgi:restriction system protein